MYGMCDYFLNRKSEVKDASAFHFGESFSPEELVSANWFQIAETNFQLLYSKHFLNGSHYSFELRFWNYVTIQQCSLKIPKSYLNT